MKKKYQNTIIILILITILTLSVINSPIVVKTILSYTTLFIEKLFPSTFFIFIIASLLISYNFINLVSNTLNINGSIFYIITMSIISGFPSGSKYITELLNKKIISTKLANYLIMFTHFPNPIFILGSVSILFNNKIIATYILLSSILSNLIIGIIFKPKEKESSPKSILPNNTFSINLKNAITSSIKTIILIYGTSIFFVIIITLINHYISFNLYPYILLNGTFDLTKGIFLTSLINNDITKAIIIITLISIGGISINMQVKSIIADTSIKYKNFLLGRILQLIISLLIFLILINIF